MSNVAEQLWSLLDEEGMLEILLLELVGCMLGMGEWCFLLEVVCRLRCSQKHLEIGRFGLGWLLILMRTESLLLMMGDLV